MGIKIGGKIEKVDGKSLTYKEFVEIYMKKNQPVVLTGLMDDWRACRDWVTQDGQPNLHFFSSHFGNSKVQVADCGRREFTDQARVEMSVSDFVQHWLEISSKGGDESLLYLKDWHFVKEYPEYVAYTTPLFFRDDWLNLYLDWYHMHTDPDTYHEKNEISCSDYRFVYMGAKGTWTPLHADVFRSYSWSANVCGKKQWFFLSPSQCHLLFDRNLKNSVYDIFDDVSDTKFPGFEKAIWLECTQERNEVIFVPSGWYHQVQNMEDTISINHNWFNAYNLSWVWKLLLKDYKEAKEYIEDIKDICDDFEGLCQRNLAANTGMNFCDFFNFITRFSLVNWIRLFKFYNKKSQNGISGSYSSTEPLLSNLISIKKIAMNMKSVGSTKGQHSSSFDVREVLKESQFLDLCMALGKTYGVLDDHRKHYSDTSEPLRVSDLQYVEATCSTVSSLEDLIGVINCALTQLGFESCDTNYSLSEHELEIEISTVL